MSDDKILTLEQILEKFIEANQQVYSDLELLGLILDAIEVILIPTERRLLVRVREYKDNTLQTHQMDKSLVMKNDNLDVTLKRSLSHGAILRGTDMRNLDPVTLERILVDIKDNQPNGEQE